MPAPDADRLVAPVRSALRDVAAALEQAGVAWRLGGSALLAVHGVPVDGQPVEVGDLDVTVAAGALEDVRTASGPWIRSVAVGEAPPPWCSDWLVRLDVGGVGVDVIGGFCVQTPTGRVAIPQDVAGRLDLDGVSVPLADPAVWWWVYRAYRPAKAEALARVLTADRRAAMAQRLGG